MKITTDLLLNGTGKLSIPISTTWYPTSNNEIYENNLIPKTIQQYIPSVGDFEKVAFEPLNCNRFRFRLKDALGAAITYGDLGFDNNDVKFNKNRFKKSFFQFNFYDTPNPATQKLAYQFVIYTQIGALQRDVNRYPLPANNMPVTFDICNPFTFNKFTEGFFIYFYKNLETLPLGLSYPLNLYCYVTFNNALNGTSTPLISYNNLITTQNLYTYYHLTYQLSSINNDNKYLVDPTDRDITTILNTTNIDLYILTL